MKIWQFYILLSNITVSENEDDGGGDDDDDDDICLI